MILTEKQVTAVEAFQGKIGATSGKNILVFRILKNNFGILVKSTKLYDEIWGYRAENSLRVAITYLRHVLEKNPEIGLTISTVHGRGYILEEIGTV